MIFEIWRPVIGYEGLYYVSDLGRVKTNNKILAGHIAKNGYVQFSLRKNNKNRTLRAHNLVAEAFIGYRKDGFVVNHKDSVRTNNRLENLEYITSADNVFHMVKMKRHIHGNRTPWAKLSDDKVNDIRIKYKQGDTSLRELAKEYSVDHTTIHAICKNRIWKHILNEVNI